MGSLRSLLRKRAPRVLSPKVSPIQFERDIERNGLLGYYFQYRNWYCKLAIRSTQIQTRRFSIILLGCQYPLKEWDSKGVFRVMHQADWFCLYTDRRNSFITEMSYPDAEEALRKLMDQFQNGTFLSRKKFESCFKVEKCRDKNLLENLFEKE
jgi:hypothetical protein